MIKTKFAGNPTANSKSTKATLLLDGGKLTNFNINDYVTRKTSLGV